MELNEIYKFSVGHFLADVYFMFPFRKNTNENQKFYLLTKIRDIRKKR